MFIQNLYDSRLVIDENEIKNKIVNKLLKLVVSDALERFDLRVKSSGLNSDNTHFFIKNNFMRMIFMQTW